MTPLKGCPTKVAGRPVSGAAALVACVVATLAFSVYARTLLPGVDLGDTGGFQAAVLWPETSARQAYPLYYSLARPFVLAVSPDNPARGLNLFSAVCGGLAIGLLTYVGSTAERQRPRRRTRGTAAGVLAHVLDAVGDRRSLCAAYRAGRRLSPRAVRVPAAAHPAAAGGVLRRLRRVLRQSPVDDPAPGAVRGVPVRRAPPATRPAAPEHRRPCAGDRTHGRPALRAQLSVCMDEHRRAVRLGRPRRNVLVRRDEGRLARHDDGRRRPERVDRTRQRCGSGTHACNSGSPG